MVIYYTENKKKKEKEKIKIKNKKRRKRESSLPLYKYATTKFVLSTNHKYGAEALELFLKKQRFRILFGRAKALNLFK